MDKYQYTILYVDDESVNIELFQTIFLRMSKVIVANSAMDGLEILKNHNIDLIVTDEKMPGMTGIEFLQEVNNLFPTMPPYRLLTSAYSKPSRIEEAFSKYQLHQFVSKPWNIKELRDIVKQLFDKIDRSKQ